VLNALLYLIQHNRVFSACCTIYLINLLPKISSIPSFSPEVCELSTIKAGCIFANLSGVLKNNVEIF